MEVGGQNHAPAALSPEKTRYPLYRRLGGPQSRSGRVRKYIYGNEFSARNDYSTVMLLVLNEAPTIGIFCKKYFWRLCETIGNLC